ncbi:NACHT domain-containing protein [Candidatus Thiosymbion oneisti]|uniref:NACHT domain-containing protein n=1 Tax=Candidatus Thiosymbion oneisti TaxID=589554 RepID=UPI00105BC336|nr:NACHT domain-containing protein [Candidatus Thiosymbion oneisti]
MSLLDWFLLVLLVAAGGMGLWAFYFWWKRDRYTRERFAFSGFSALLGFGILILGGLSFNTSIVGGPLFILLKLFELTPWSAPPSLTPLEAVLIVLLFGSLVYAYVRVFTAWTGRKSLAQHEQEQNREAASVLRDIKLLLSPRPEARQRRAPYQGAAEPDPDLLERPESLVWHERARQLWLLRNRSYRFEGEYDPAHNCWLGEEKHTGALAVLACYHQAPQDLSELVDYARKVADNQGRAGIELIVALKDQAPAPEETFADCSLTYTSEAALLVDSVDFSNYFEDIRYRVERARLTDSDLTLQDVYTPSSYRLESEKNKIRDQTLEAFIHDWLQANTQRQLALLGEYGQGKSTASLLLCYHLIKQAETGADVRIPVLIELRGKNLRTLTPEELLATWAYHYDISVQALLHLHLAGRLLLIFDGFDEMDLSGDTEARINHFRTLWRLNYPEAKIIVTGRPNFFLGSKEFRRALGNAEQTHTLYLAPFNLDQIADSLRKADASTRTEILELARRDGKFHEVVARPSLLYAVSLLWRQEQLSERRHIDSALVIDLFIRQTLKRQQGKQDERPFMILNSAERHYFMTGIAAYMAAKNLPNQIDGHQLEEAVDRLVAAIPDTVSQSVGAVGNEDSHPLRSTARREWQTKRSEIMHAINTDVRSCGLLVTDPTKDGNFKFAHKSYLELLQAQTISRRFSTNETEQRSGHSIANTWKLGIGNLQGSDEAMGFLAELLQETLHKRGISEEPAVAKGLWDILVVDKSSSRQTIVGFFKSKWTAAADSLACQLVSRFGIEMSDIQADGVFVLVSKIASTAATVVAAAVIAFIAGLVIVKGTVVGIIAALVVASLALAGAVAVAGEIIALVGTFTAAIMGMVMEPRTNAELLPVLVVMAVGALLFSLVMGLAADFLADHKTTIFKRLQLWYRACQDLGLPSSAIEKTAGKGMTALLEDAQARHDGGTSDQPDNDIKQPVV